MVYNAGGEHDESPKRAKGKKLRKDMIANKSIDIIN